MRHIPVTTSVGEIHALAAGAAGTPVILIHGLDGSAANYLDLLPLLAAHHRVLAPDLPGFGRTPLAGRRTSMRSYAALTTELATGFDVPPVLVGNSMGGVVALLTAAGLADRTAGVVLLAPALPRAGTGAIDLSLAPAWAGLWSPAGSLTPRARQSQDPRTRVAALLDLCVPGGRPGSRAAFEEMVAVAEARDPADHRAAWTGAARSLWTWLLRRGAFHQMADTITAPVHLVAGERDPIIPATSVDAAATRHPSWDVAVLDGVGHVPPLERPDVVARIISDVGISAPGGPAAGGRPHPRPPSPSGRTPA